MYPTLFCRVLRILQMNNYQDKTKEMIQTNSKKGGNLENKNNKK